MKTEFLKEWNKQQFTTAQKAITKFINSRYWETHHSPDADPFIKYNKRTFTGISEILGLAYTSTGDFAGYWVCNTELYLDNAHKWNLVGFAIGSNSFVHAIFYDAAENEITFPIN